MEHGAVIEQLTSVAVVIVAYRSGDHLESCLAALAGSGHHVVVVDNSPEPRPNSPAGVDWFHAGRNLGFAGGVNEGVKRTKAPLILILNPDCMLLTGLEGLAAEFADPRVGAAGGRLVDETGNPQTGFEARRLPTAATLSAEILGLNRLFPWNRINRWYRMRDTPLTRPTDVEQPAGAMLMVRRSAFEAVGGFDERFHPVWFEDVDFCGRLIKGGWRIRFTPLTRARHVGGHSVDTMAEASKTLAWYGSLLRYSVKHLGSAGSKAVSVSLMLAALPRGVMGSLRSGTLSPLRAHWTLFLRAMWILMGRSAG